MPQPTNHAKKKKSGSSSVGRLPAYQNTFAFKHNPKSKKTATILASPIYHCCQRCHDKIVWRKQYRKYKPLTQPSVCNLCNKRNVMAAYHTVCDSCSTDHAKALELLRIWNDTSSMIPNGKQSATDETDGIPPMVADRTSSYLHSRVCAVCFKLPALPDSGESTTTDGQPSSISSDKPLKLRDIKSLQRKNDKKGRQKCGKSTRGDDANESDHSSIRDGDEDQDDCYVRYRNQNQHQN